MNGAATTGFYCICHEDSVVAVSNSISFYEALRENEISAAQCRMDRKQ